MLIIGERINSITPESARLDPIPRLDVNSGARMSATVLSEGTPIAKTPFDSIEVFPYNTLLN